MTAIPDYEQWSRALTDSRLARDMCFEAIGYARGYCDASGIGSGDAVDFGLTFAVLVASRSSRPSIDDAWANWRAGRDLNDHSPHNR